MIDQLDLRLFPQDGTDFLKTLDYPVYGLMAGSWAETPLAENLLMHRDLGEAVKVNFLNFIVYGEDKSEERLLMLLNAPQNLDSNLYTFLQSHTRRMSQHGFCFGYQSETTCKFLLPDQDYLEGKDIAKFDGSPAVFNEWAGNIYPEFKVKGYFPRNVLYIQCKLREHGL